MKIGYIVFLLFFVSCASFKTRDVVLQKSIHPTPDWVFKNGEASLQYPGFINLVFSKRDLYNLPLGLKQSQEIVSKKFYDLILWEVYSQILTQAGKSIPNSENALNTHLLTVINNQKSSLYISTPPVAQDVYWEYQQSGKTHDFRQHYVVWVLLLVPKQVYSQALLTIAKELQNSPEAPIAQVSRNILQQPAEYPLKVQNIKL